jgi:hypothetical protein
MVTPVSGPPALPPDFPHGTAGCPGPQPVWRDHGSVASWAQKPNGTPRVNGSAPMPWIRPSTITTAPPQNGGRSASPTAAAPRRVHRRPPGPHDYRHRTHRLVGPRHTATTLMITTARHSRRKCPDCHRPWPLPRDRVPSPACSPSGTWHRSPMARNLDDGAGCRCSVMPMASGY